MSGILHIDAIKKNFFWSLHAIEDGGWIDFLRQKSDSAWAFSTTRSLQITSIFYYTTTTGGMRLQNRCNWYMPEPGRNTIFENKEKEPFGWMVKVNHSDSKIDLFNCDCRTIDIKVPVFISLWFGTGIVIVEFLIFFCKLYGYHVVVFLRSHAELVSDKLADRKEPVI